MKILTPSKCGKVREVKITELSGAVVATVEFFERVSFLSRTVSVDSAG